MTLNGLTKHFHYLSYVLRHKYYVAQECFKQGLIWRGLFHDWSKFLPCEWFPYVEFFYGYEENNKPRHVKDAFNKAWKHHQRFNDHHWAHWCTISNDIWCSPSWNPMFREAVIEMLCDWKGTSMVKHEGNTWGDVFDWYHKNKCTMYLHYETRRLVEVLLSSFAGARNVAT